MATGLETALKGLFQDLILTKPTNAETPFLYLENTVIIVKGFAVVPAQKTWVLLVFLRDKIGRSPKASKEEFSLLRYQH